MDIEEMTLEEVIETLQVWISTADDEYDREEHGRVCGLKEALHEIKKIKPCADAISRSDAIRVASGYCHWSNIPDELAKLPSVNTEKTGRWKKISPANIYECSECGQNVMTDDICAYKFCHGCGARMREVGESE